MKRFLDILFQFRMAGLVIGAFILVLVLGLSQRYKIYSWIQGMRAGSDPSRAASLYLEGQEILAEAREKGLPFDLEKLFTACRIYQLLDPVYYGYYQSPWSERNRLFPSIGSSGPFHRKFLSRNMQPDEYWSVHRSKLVKLLELRRKAFAYGGLEYTYAEGYARAALAFCRPDLALSSLAEYLDRWEEAALAEADEEMEGASQQHANGAFLIRLAEERSYTTALDNYLAWYHIFPAHRMQSRLQGELSRLVLSSPWEAMRLMRRRKEIAVLMKKRQTAQTLSCLLADLERKLYLKQSYQRIRPPELSLNEDQVLASHNSCLVQADPLQEAEAYLGLAELDLKAGRRQRARTHLEAGRKLPQVVLSIPRLRVYYRNRIDAIHYALPQTTP
jgi:hypothetical protein